MVGKDLCKCHVATKLIRDYFTAKFGIIHTRANVTSLRLMVLRTSSLLGVYHNAPEMRCTFRKEIHRVECCFSRYGFPRKIKYSVDIFFSESFDCRIQRCHCFTRSGGSRCYEPSTAADGLHNAHHQLVLSFSYVSVRERELLYFIKSCTFSLGENFNKWFYTANQGFRHFRKLLCSI